VEKLESDHKEGIRREGRDKTFPSSNSICVSAIEMGNNAGIGDCGRGRRI
jgi:hypothetical protein